MTIFLLACIIFHQISFAQVRTIASAHEISNSSEDVAVNDNSHDLGVGGGIGQTKLYAQLPLSSPQNAYFICFEKNEGQGLSYGATISSGGLESSYPLYDLGSYNRFTSFDLHLNISWSAFFVAFNKNYSNYQNIITKITDNLYIGIGAGAINNNITRIKALDTITVNPDSGKPVIKRQSIVPYLPFNVGYSLYLTKRIIVNANFQYTWCLGNYVDGYNMPFSGHRHTAVYTMASIGIRYVIIHNRTGGREQEQ